MTAFLAVIAASASWTCGAAPALGETRHRDVILAQSTVKDATPLPAPSPPTGVPSAVLAWNFGMPPPSTGESWTAERGATTVGEGGARLQPDANRRVVLLSPPGLSEGARYAEEFVLGLSGTGLERVRIQARRDARGGWITIADASGAALRETAAGYVVKRSLGASGAPIERLRIELQFRATNPRVLTRIAIR